MTARAIPSYELYGELLSTPYTDPVHHETIKERSSQHGWTIRLHRHKSLAQVFVFKTPGVSIRLGDATHTTSDALILLIPPGVAHGFRFEEDVMGDVLSLRIDELGPDIAEMLSRPEMKSGGILQGMPGSNFNFIDATIGQLRQVYHGVKIERRELLVTLTKTILTYISGDLRRQTGLQQVAQAKPLTRHEAQADAFCTLVEECFREGLSVADYADRINVSAPHLTRLCRNILGATPNALVRQRRLLEAKRLLEYTQLSISEIAHRSGFHDPSFFSRSFSRAFGVSPKSYRDARGH